MIYSGYLNLLEKVSFDRVSSTYSIRINAYYLSNNWRREKDNLDIKYKQAVISITSKTAHIEELKKEGKSQEEISNEIEKIWQDYVEYGYDNLNSEWVTMKFLCDEKGNVIEFFKSYKNNNEDIQYFFEDLFKKGDITEEELATLNKYKEYGICCISHNAY